MKYLSVEKRCELIVDAYHSIYKVLEKPLLKSVTTEGRGEDETINYGVIFRTRSRTTTDSSETKTYNYDYKGKEDTFKEAITPYLDGLGGFEAGKTGTLVIFKSKALLENMKNYGKACLYELVPNVTVVEYNFSDVVNSKSCYIDCTFPQGKLSLDGEIVLSRSEFGMREKTSKEFLVDLFYLLSSAKDLVQSRNIVQIEDWVSIAEAVAYSCPSMKLYMVCLEWGGTYEYKDVCGQRSWVGKQQTTGKLK